MDYISTFRIFRFSYFMFLFVVILAVPHVSKDYHEHCNESV